VGDVRVVNISLLTKWRWRLLYDDNMVWKEVLKSKYGSGVIGRTVLGEECKPWYASLWWKDICTIGSNLDLDWFSQGVSKKLGNGRLTSFWTEKWVGDLPLCVRFPRLFSISMHKEATVADVWNQSIAPDSWRLNWRRRLFEWEKELVNELMLLINPVVFRMEEEDRWGWEPEGGANFTVKSTYQKVFNLSTHEGVVDPWNASVFSVIWKCPAPSKVSGFVWQLLHGRIPTRKNLVARRVIDGDGDISCALCGEETESELHLFLYCEIAMLVWIVIFFWLDVPFCLPHNIFSIIHCLLEAGGKKSRQGMGTICAAVCWNIWRCHNSIVFDNGNGSVMELVEAIKVSSWKWWLSRSAAANCLLYEWRAEPRLCVLR
jgi:hypothetical protein